MARQLLLASHWKDIKAIDLLTALSDLAFEVGESTTAFRILRRIIQLTPNDVHASLRLGQALRRSGQKQEALPYLQRAQQLEPQNEQVLYELALVLEDLQHYDEALAHIRQALRQNPQDADLLNVAASNLCNLGNPEEAIPLYVQAIEQEPDFHALSFNLSQALLQAGQWREGWRFFDYRLVLRPPEKRPESSAPLWKGESLAGKSILIWQEQGFGDTIQFLRFLPVLTEMKAEVTVLINGQLITLAEKNFPDCTFIDQRQSPLPTDYQLPILSLPRRLELNDPQMLTGEAYLTCKETEALAGNDNLRIGLVWAGNPNHPDDHRRSITSALLSPLLKTAGVAWYSFQVGRHEWAEEQNAIHDLRPQLTNFLATAQYIRQMDLIISVDTAVAHLAGAMGTTTWLLLDYAADWRWGSHPNQTEWYQSMRLFRQKRPGDWSGVIQQVQKVLHNLYS